MQFVLLHPFFVHTFFMKRITVFCGSSWGTEKIFEEQAFLLGKTLADQHIGLVYGGAKVGLMGAVADGALQNGGEVIGVLPHFLGSKEIAHENLSQLIMVESMHERKMKMNDLSDGIIALPGGFGTLEELFEMLTWGQLGLHKKPMGILNINGFYDELLSFVESMFAKGFIKQIHRDMLLHSNGIDGLLEKMKNYEAPPNPKWISKENT